MVKASLKPDFNLLRTNCQDTVNLTRPYRFDLVLLSRDRQGEGLPLLHPLTPAGSPLHFSDQRFSSGGEFVSKETNPDPFKVDQTILV